MLQYDLETLGETFHQQQRCPKKIVTGKQATLQSPQAQAQQLVLANCDVYAQLKSIEP